MSVREVVGFVGAVTMLIPGLNVVTRIAIVVADYALQQILAPKAKGPPSPRHMVTAPDAFLPVIYGETRAGTLVTFAGSTGQQNYLWLVCAIGTGELDAITGIYLDGNLAVDATGTLRHKGVTKTLGANTLETPCRIACTAHGFALGDTVNIKEHGAGLDGDWRVEDTPDADHFVVAATASAVASGGGASRLNPGFWTTIRWQGHDVDSWPLVAWAKYLGKDSQDMSSAPGQPNGPTADSTLRASDLTAAIPGWDATHVGSGKSYLIVKLLYWPDVFPGVPEVTVSVRGRKVYDPRNATTAWSANPALCVRDYVTNARYGVGGTMYDGDASEGLIAEANYCDELVDAPAGTGMPAITSSSAATDQVFAPNHNLAAGNRIWIRNHVGAVPVLNGLQVVKAVQDASHFTLDNGSGGTLNITTGGTGGSAQKLVQQARFAAHGQLDTGQEQASNIETVLGSCRGMLSWRGGTYHLHVRRAKSLTYLDPPTNSRGLDESVIIGDWDFAIPGAQSVPNSIRFTFPNRLTAYETDVGEWPPVSAANPYLTADKGFANQRSVGFAFVDNRYRGEQIAMTVLEEVRAGCVATVTCKEEALKLAVADVVPVTTAWWVAKPFWVMGMGILPTREVRVALMEYVAAAYDAQMTDDEALRTGIAMPLPWNVPAPTNLVLTTGTTEPAIRASWTAAPDARIARYEVQGQRSGDPNWREFGYVTADTLSAIIAPVSDGENWTVQVRALTAAGIHSEWLSAIHTVSLIGGSLFTYTVSADASSVTYALTYGVNCALMELYTIQHEASGGANPTLTPADLAASMPRPASGLFTQRVATKANYYRRTRIVSYNAAGAPGQDSGVIETQAVTTGGPPSAPPNTLAKVSATGTTLTISWVNGDAAAVTRIYLDGVVIYPAPAGQTGYTIQGLSPSHTYQVDADHFKNGQASTKNGAVAMTTAAVTLDAPVGFAANGIMGPPIYMGFGWAMGANAEGATTSMQESAIGDFSDAVPVADASPTPPGATTATSAQHTSGSYSFRAKHQRPDSTDSGWSNVVIATYGGAAE